ncbi:MAG: bifunctional 5,10-methylenetetrahydrofolate dehydrogenase/5,10-methenyltetrahydrofolate cyclohydrolase [Treponema sp.]|jgi:methylenetetrahydrofolate dehydrogenase (NADP+)/methenyltetrahydrofolate cyclohydrolase|nr:bifunctional 5,10-methylenetetrahydrofolate dehydrogenase/5,10-methenyltetrahydrofolate cyclohydrolase [Treponema sp.]
MVQILSGKETAAAMTESLRKDAEELKARGILPALGIIRLGRREADLSYERGITKRCAAAGVEVKSRALAEDTSGEALLDLIGDLNADGSIHGILIFRPLPPHIDDNAVRNALLPAKDVDGVTDASLAGVFTGSSRGFPPCTAEACLEILSHYGIDPAGKRAVVVGRSLVAGRPAALLLMHRHSTVTVCHTRTRDLPSVVREGDLVIAAAGKPEFLGRECFREGQVIVDVGIHAGPGNVLCGDVNFAEAAETAAAITPVPGGVGAVTPSVLARHVIEAAKASGPFCCAAPEN